MDVDNINKIKEFARVQTLRLDSRLHKTDNEGLSIREMAIVQILIELICEHFGKLDSIEVSK